MGRGSSSGGFRSLSSRGGGSSRTHYGGNAGSRGGYSSGRSSSSSSGGGSGYRRFSPSRTYYGRRPSGCSVVAAVLVIVLVIFVLLFQSCTGVFGNGETSDITSSTLERSKLPSSQCKQISGWYEDHMSQRWIYNENVLIKGMKSFYSKTGVQPYLVLIEDVDGNSHPTDTELTNYLADVYDDVMPDGGHLVVGLLEGSPGDYAIGCYAGFAAESVMDNEAKEILLDYLDYYYVSDMDDEEYFSKVFEMTADKIMTVDKIKSAVWGKVVIVALIVAGVIAVGIVIVRRHKHKADRARADADILNSNLGNSNSNDPLKDKYDVR